MEYLGKRKFHVKIHLVFAASAKVTSKELRVSATLLQYLFKFLSPLSLLRWGGLFAASLMSFAVAAQADTETVAETLTETRTATKSEPFFSECAYIEFEDIDPTQLTRDELIALEEESLFRSLERTEKCMEAAVSTGAEKLAAAADSGGDSGAEASSGSSGGSSNSADETDEQSEEAVTEVEESSKSATQTSEGKGNSGSSAVCDAVRSGLEAATTQAEKDHFSALMTEYGCQ